MGKDLCTQICAGLDSLQQLRNVEKRRRLWLLPPCLYKLNSGWREGLELKGVCLSNVAENDFTAIATKAQTRPTKCRRGAKKHPTFRSSLYNRIAIQSCLYITT